MGFASEVPVHPVAISLDSDPQRPYFGDMLTACEASA